MISVGYMFSGLGLHGNPFELIWFLGNVSLILLSFPFEFLMISVGYRFQSLGLQGNPLELIRFPVDAILRLLCFRNEFNDFCNKIEMGLVQPRAWRNVTITLTLKLNWGLIFKGIFNNWNVKLRWRIIFKRIAGCME